MNPEQPHELAVFSNRLRRISPAAEMLAADESMFLLYESFKNESVDELVRTRGDLQVRYDRVVRTAITLRGTHMLQLLIGQSNRYPGVDAASQYLVRTADFANHDVTEWWVYKIKQSPMGITPVQKKLFLTNQPVQELIPSPVYEANMDPLNEGRLRYSVELAEEDEDYTAITYTLNGSRAMLSWGNGTQPHSLRDVTEVDYELIALSSYYAVQQATELTHEKTVHKSLQQYVGQLLSA
jgi:hypothetical protein